MVTQAQFDTFKTEAIAKQPLRRVCQMSDLKFITMDAVEFKGLTLGISRKALKKLVHIVGFSTVGADQLKGAIGEEGSVNILNSLKNVLSSAKREICIHVSPDRIITHITDSKSPIISAETYFDTVERLINRHDLDIKSTSFNGENGNIYVEALASVKRREFQIGNLSTESFHSGISLSRTAEGIKAEPYMQRLVCTNGMVARNFEESFHLGSMNQRAWQEFYEHLNRIEHGGFVPVKFSNAVTSAMNSPASLAELEQGQRLISDSSNCKGDDLETFVRSKGTYSRIHSAGIDTEKLTDTQKRNLRTGISLWDVINGVTDFASHNYGFEKKPNSNRHLQMRAGDLLTKGPDTRNLILNQPF
jgi:hypothetical protein